MTSNQRRPGFRLPWASETDDLAAADESPEPGRAALAGDAPAVEQQAPNFKRSVLQVVHEPAPPTIFDATPIADTTVAPETSSVEPSPEPSSDGAVLASPPDASSGFMRDLVAAMRRVAEETRQSGLSDLRTKAEDQVRTLEADSEHRREALTARAEADLAGVDEWARAETARIKEEAEQRVVARRAQLDQQLAAESSRSESEAAVLREQVAQYERELDAYHAQLSDIADPAAFAVAAKRLPPPPALTPAPPAARPATPKVPESTNGIASDPPIHPSEEEVLASRLTRLAGSPPPTEGAQTPTQPPPSGDAGETATDSTSTEILVKGLGSFGAITGFRQALASADGVEGVSLSLGPTGEFVFRAVHANGFDVAMAITALEGDAATIEHHADGGLRVTLDRGR